MFKEWNVYFYKHGCFQCYSCFDFVSFKNTSWEEP